MPRGSVPTTPPIVRIIDYKSTVVQAWGDQFLRPDTAYRFSNGRTFNDPAPNGGPYTGTSGNG